MNLGLIILILSPIIGAYSLLVGFGVLAPKKLSEKSQEDAVKFKKTQKIGGIAMMVLFSFYLMKFLFFEV